MTPDMIIDGLRNAARRCDDAALASEAEAATHRPEYDGLRAAQTPAGPREHERLLELYPYVVQRDHEATQLREEAKLLREAADLIEVQADKLMRARERS